MSSLVSDTAATSVLEAIQSRRSVRRYAPDPLPHSVLERLLTAATWAPSAHNRQPWRFAVVEQVAAKARLAAQMGADLRRDRLADGDPLEAVEKDVRRSYDRITGAPVVVAACLSMADMDRYPDERRNHAERLMAVQSVAMALQNLLLAAHAEHIGACWMCAPLFCPGAVRAALDLPQDWEPQALISLGYPDGPARRRGRRPLADFVRYCA